MRAFISTLGFLLASAAVACADVAFLPASGDTTLYQDSSGASANGAGDFFFAGTTDVGAIRRGLIQFDVAGALPAGATITGATLTLHMSRTNTGPQAVSLHRALESWVEGSTHAPGLEGAGGPAEPGDATWIHRSSPDLFWTTPGGVYEPEPSATIFVGGYDFYQWSGDGLVADVALWAADPGVNHGWVLLGDEEFTTTAKRFDSRTNPDIEFQPVLRIEYIAVPAPAAGLALLTGLAAPVARRTRRVHHR